MRHSHARGKPCEEVVVNRTTALQFRDPRVATRNAPRNAPVMESLRGSADVVRPPIVAAFVCEGYEPADGRNPFSASACRCPDAHTARFMPLIRRSARQLGDKLTKWV